MVQTSTALNFNHVCFQEVNDLTERAHTRWIESVTGFGNRLTKEHEDAVWKVMDLYTRLAFGLTTGRHAVSLGTGLGKTTSCIAWATELVLSGYDDISLAVCSNTVEALCSIKRALIKGGVSEDRIGLWHSYQYDSEMAEKYIQREILELPKGHASEEATDINEIQGKQILLCTHNRVRGKRNLEDLNTFMGEKRNLLVWDESLLLSDCYSLEERFLRRDMKWFSDPAGNKVFRELGEYLQQCIEIIDTERIAQQHDGRPPSPLHMPELTQKQIDTFEAALPTGEARKLVGNATAAFLGMVHLPLRFHCSKETGVITYDPVIDSSLDKVVVLDASFPIRKLCDLDDSIQRLKDIKLDRIVSYENVQIHQLRFYSGKHTMEQEVSKLQEADTGVVREAVEVIKGIPNQSILVVTFKSHSPRQERYRKTRKRGDNGQILVDYIKAIKDSLKKNGVDPEKTIIIDGVPRPRISFLTWGNHTSLNDFSHCTTVILAGVLHRGNLDLASQVLGQKRDLLAEFDYGLEKEIMHTEIVHDLYQALSRGSCRVVRNGKAKPMNVYLIHKHIDIRKALSEVMPGVQWVEWIPKFMIPKTKARTIEQQIRSYLEDLPENVVMISTRLLKADLKVDDTVCHRNTFLESVKRVIQGSEWSLYRRSLFRDTPLFPPV